MDCKVQAETPKLLESVASDHTGGSHFALQVALQTMKERCQNLQARLAYVEEENVTLRSKNSLMQKPDNVSPEVKSEVEQLQEQVSQLTRQKSQLTHHICMVATENHQLWNRLSRVTQANQSLGSHLSKISDSLSKHDSSVSGKAEYQKLSAVSNIVVKKIEAKGLNPTTTDPNDQSLDEISLKLINSLIQEKAELEDQYLQMVDIQSNNTFPIQNLGFTFVDQGDESTVKEVNEHCLELQEMKQTLTDQHKVLKNTIQTLEKFKNDKEKLCHQCREKEKRRSIAELKNEDKAYMDTLRQWGATHNINDRMQRETEAGPEKSLSLADGNTNLDDNVTPVKILEGIQNEDRLCPMCGQFYPRQLPYEEFQTHVMSHFNDEFDPALENFEVVM